ncbi:MAG TPA: NYN domain-containing protein [Gemmatimonadaceae bacterium]
MESSPAGSKPSCPRLEIFVDGTNFQYGAYTLLGQRYLDVPHLARRIAKQLEPQEPGHILVKLHYCTAPITATEGAQFEVQKRFFAAVREAHSTSLHLGRHDALKGAQRGSHEEKQTDVNVAIHAIQGLYQDRYETAMIVSGDTDLVPAFKMIKESGKRVVWGRFRHERTTVIVLILFGLTQPAVRHSMGGVLIAVAHRKILTPLLLAAAYTIGVVAIFNRIGLWYFPDLKDTVLWFVFGGIIETFSLVNNRERVRFVGLRIRKRSRCHSVRTEA